MSAATAKRRRILAVEDDEAILESFRVLLEDEGYEVFVAKNGREALDLLRNMTELPALILLDFMMPVMDGEAFRKEQELDPRLAGIPILVLSATGRIETKSQMAGLKHFLAKPVDLNLLIETIEKLAG